VGVRFDDSLPKLVEVVADELGKEVTESSAALRDSAGRLAFFASVDLCQAAIERLTTRLRRELGVYARTDRVVAALGDFGAEEVLTDRTALFTNVRGFTVRVVDRRLVGADWLREPSPAAPAPPRFVFASLKGGVGRSTALSVAAADIASRGRRVLTIDLDMEAPGLGAMLLDKDTVPEFGLIDALVENGLGPLDESFLADLVGPSPLADRQGRIDVIPAFGRRCLENPGEVLAKIARAYAENVQEDGSVATILDQVSVLVKHFADPKRYDVILVDSRAGLHETTASAILGLGADVFLFGLNEPQTFQGYPALLGHLARFVRPAGPTPEWLERITMVQSKAPSPESKQEFVEKCRTLFSEVGLGFRPRTNTVEVPLPAEPFGDVPWDDDVQDEDLMLDPEAGPREPLCILEDERFRFFNPASRQDLLSKQLYGASFGMFLDRISEALSISDEEIQS
jgi:CobQ/CobB/MinD/ParA nucleotide binding domain